MASLVVPPVDAVAGENVNMMELPWPGMGVMIPKVPADVPNSDIYIAGPLDECEICGILPGLSTDHLAGEGLASCAVSDTCKASTDSTKTSGGSKKEEVMWNPPSGAGLANTSIAILEFTTTYTPTSTISRISNVNVGKAVESVSQSMNLPQRFHLKVAPEFTNPLLFDDADYLISVLADVDPETGLGSAGGASEYGTSMVDEEAEWMAQMEGKEVFEECSQTKTFRVFVVSDWLNVTQAQVKGLKTDSASEALGQALQKEEGGNVNICSMTVNKAASLFIPGKAISFLQDGASPFALGDQGLPSAVAELVDTETGDRVEDVVIGHTYALDMQHFTPSTPLTVRLWPANGTALTVGAFQAKPTTDTHTQTWNWTVPDVVRPGAYYLEVSTPPAATDAASAAASAVGASSAAGLASAAGMLNKMDDNKFAYTQAFEVSQ